MSGHSHWSGIKHRKGINDSKKAKLFTKAGKIITLAARFGGGSPETNLQLKAAIDQAKSVNMPKENIERAIKRGTGELKGEEISEVIYEAVGPGNVMMLIKATTDNKNRTVSELKTLLVKAGGKLGEPGSVAWNFKRVGEINVSVPKGGDPYETELLAIESGAEETAYAGNTLTIYTRPEEIKNVQEKLLEKKLPVENASLSYYPLQKNSLSLNDKLDYEKLLENLDEQDDVEEIYDNIA